MEKLTMPNDVLIPEIGNMVNKGISVTMRVKGNSMLPFIIGDCDSVVLEKAKTIQCGDIVLAKTTDNRFVLHRIISIKDNHVILMGDGNIKGTEKCTTENILGKAIKIIHGNRYISTDDPKEIRKYKLWFKLRPIRRWILAIYKRCIIPYQK